MTNSHMQLQVEWLHNTRFLLVELVWIFDFKENQIGHYNELFS
jgi:hypothetical protein